MLSSHTPYLYDLIIQKLEHVIPLAMLRCSMPNFICFVFDVSCPAEVSWIDAAAVPIAAAMCRLISIRSIAVILSAGQPTY